MPLSLRRLASLSSSPGYKSLLNADIKSSLWSCKETAGMGGSHSWGFIPGSFAKKAADQGYWESQTFLLPLVSLPSALLSEQATSTKATKSVRSQAQGQVYGSCQRSEPSSNPHCWKKSPDKGCCLASYQEIWTLSDTTTVKTPLIKSLCVFCCW